MRAALVLTLVATLAVAVPHNVARAAVTRQNRPVTAFHAVRLVGAIDLVATQSDTASLSLEGDSDQLKDVTTDVEDGTLVIAYRSGWSLWSWFRVPATAPRALLSVTALDRLAVEGSGDAQVQTLAVQDHLEIQVTGSGDVRLATLAAHSVEVRIAGSGDVRIGGAVLEESVRIAGSGDFYGGELKSARGKVAIAGSGDAVVWVRDALEVSISGSGDLEYYGSPTLSQSRSGSGSIKGLGSKN
jgi:hypothetical protein